MLKRFVINGNLAILLGFCGLIYGALFVHMGSFVLSSSEFKCTETSFTGTAPNRQENCIRYERK